MTVTHERLAEHHLADLRRSGLTDETIEAAGFRSLSAADTKALLERDDVGGGMVIPYPGCFFSDGAPYVRVRLDTALTRDGHSIRYLTKKSERNRLYVPPLVPSSVLDDPNLMLVVVEGEKKALKGCQEGFHCVGLAGVWSWRTKLDGESAPLPKFDAITWQTRSTAIAYDSDSRTNDSVRAAREKLADELSTRGARVRIVEFPAGPLGEKVGLDDYLLTHTPEDFRELAETASLWKPPTQVHGQARSTPITPWPAGPAPAAFASRAGELVALLAPHTEADPVAVLISFLVALGNALGRGPHFEVEAAQHRVNINVVFVGKTARGRKGSSWAQVRRVFETADSHWARECIQHGLSSGEGLIWAVRDPVEKRMPVRENRRVVDYETVIEDPGVADKRLLIIEQEFASTLRVMGRDGNTLSPIIRQAWDTGDLRVLTKNSPARATAAHVSLIGHITRDEVLRYLDTTEAGNGFANRFLWACVRRSKLLPEGGRIDEADFAAFVQRLTETVEFARGIGRLRRDEEARALWHETYATLSREVPGLLGAVTARAEAQVLRLSCLYALLDKSLLIRRQHLEAALALWAYCEASARFIFGDTLGDPMADEILRALRRSDSGLTRTEINRVFKGNRAAVEIGRALGRLLEMGLAMCQPDQSTGGRPAERWYAVEPSQSTISQPTKETNGTN